MASTLEAVRRLTIQGQTVGITQASAELNELARAQGGVAVASNKTEQATLALDAKFASIERRYNTALRNQQDYAKLQSQVNAAVAQNPALQDRANAVLAAAADKYGQVTGAQKAMGIASQTVNLQIAALAGNLGITGQVLAAFGPWGLAAAVGLGAVQSAISFVSDKSHELANKAKDIREYAEATGFTTLQFQALRSEVGKFGVDGATLSTGVSKFTVGFNELRNGTGQLLTEVRRINPALAEEMQRTTDTATAFTLFGKAVQSTDNIFQRNALLRAGLGKGSTIYGAFFESGPDVAKLTESFAAAGKGIDDNLIKKLAQLQIDIDKTKSAASTVFASAFGTSTLEAEKQYAGVLLDIAKTFKLIVDTANNFPKVPANDNAASGGLPPTSIFGRMYTMARGGLAQRAAQYDARQAAPANFVSPANSYSTFQGPASVPAPLTLEAIAEQAKNLTSVLGSAATPAQKLDAQLKALDVTARAAGFSLDSAEVASAKLALRQDSAASTIGARVGALGAAATVTDLLTQKTLALAAANRNGANLTPAEVLNQKRLVIEQANGVGAINAQIDALKIQSATMGMSAGAAAEYVAVETKRLEAIRNGAPLDEKQLAALQAKAKVLGKATQAGAQAAAQDKADFDLQTVFLSDTEKQIAALNFQLHGNAWKDFMNDGLSSTIRLTDNLKTVSDSFKEVGKAAFSAALSGANGMNALIGALDGVAKKLADKGFDNLLSGLLSGDPMQMGIGALQAGASAVISVFTRDQKNAEALKKAQEEWAKAGPAFQVFLKQMSGGVQGSLSQQINQAAAQEADFEDRAWKARDTAAINAARAGLQNFSDTQKRLFQATFAATVDGLKDGLGLDSPFMKAVNSVKTALNAQLAFIDDTDVAIGENIPGTMAKAKAASQSYLLSLLQQAPALSAVQTGLMQIHGTANALQGALVQLGMSSTDAAAAINAGVAKAIASLKTQFEAGLTERLNTANGQSFLNDATKLIQQHQQDLLDAASLGTDPTLIAQVFHAEAQKIVNDAGLVGDAFTTFTKQFPDLAGVVVQATDDMSSSANKLQDALNQSAKSIVDFVNGLYAGSSSALSHPAQLAAAQLAYNTKLALAQGGNIDALNSITGDAQNLLSAAKAVYASSAGFQTIFQNVTAQLLSLPAVQNTSDPVVAAMRDVLTAINLGNAALNAANVNTTSLILPAVNAGNATNVANALKAYFDQIDPTGNLSSVVTNTLNAANSTSTAAGNTGTTATNTGNTKTSVDASNALLDLIKQANTTSATQLGILKDALSPSANAVVITYTRAGAGTSAPTIDHASYTEQMLSVLYKIAVNTWAIAGNTRALSGGAARDGTLATGGLVTGPGTGTSDSIPLWLSNREFVIKNSTVEKFGVGFFEQLNAGVLPRSVAGNDNHSRSFSAPNVINFPRGNDNAELVAEIRALRGEVEQLRMENNGGNANIVTAQREGTNGIISAVGASGKTTAAATRDARRNPRAANG